MRIERLFTTGLVALLLLSTSANALTLQWDNQPDWPLGTTVESCINDDCVSGITGNSRAFSVPPGTAIDARARAVAIDGTVSDWATLAQTYPANQYGLWANRGSVQPMAIARRGSTAKSVQWENAASASIAHETTSQVGDIILIGASAFSDEGTDVGGTVSISGFTKLGGQGRVYDPAGTYGAAQATVFYRFVDGTEGSSFSITASGSYQYGSAVLIVFSGSSLEIEANNYTDNASGTSPVSPSLTAAGTNTMLVNFYLFSDPATFTAPSGSDGSFANSPQNTNGSAVSWDAIASSGATGTRTATLGTSRDCMGWSVLLKEASGGGGDASTSLPGANSTAGIGALTLSGTADKSLTGVSGSGAVGTVSTQVLLSLLGNALSGSAGTIAGTGTADKTLSGNAGIGSAGIPTLSGSAAKAITGNSATGNIGTLSGSGGATLSLSGVSIATAAGIMSLSGAANVTLPGVFITGQIGNITASAGGSASVSLSGIAASGAAGTLTLSGAAAKSISGVSGSGAMGSIALAVAKALSGVSATGNVGAVTLSASALLSLLGVSSAASAGVISVAAGGTITLVGVSATGQTGTVTVSAGSPATITLSGAASIASVGTLALRGDALVLLSGVQADGQVGTIRLVEIVTPGGRLLLIQSDDRTLIVQPDDRTIFVMSDNSNLTIN